MSLETTGEVTRFVAGIRDDRPSRKSEHVDIDNLAASMAVEGLRHPVLLLPGGDILDGRRRVAAAKALGWTTIPIRQVEYLEDAVDALHTAKDEFTVPRTLEEMVTLGLTIEALDHRTPPSAAGAPNNDFVNRIGGAVASSGTTYKRGRYIVLAARSQKRPAHVVETAKQAMAGYDAGTLPMLTAYRRVREAANASGSSVADVVSPDGLPSTPPPSPLARSPRARLLREDWIRALAAQGAISEQIADKLGITVSGLRKIAKDIGVEILADQALAKTQRKAIDPNRAMRVAIDDLDALIWSLENVDVTRLDVTEAKEWVTLLGRYARSISSVSRKIKGVVQ